ncbi:glutamate receptor U1-like [Mya arenaria]|uniref:glutamate receptor U1-like n=1 Tax=Mya arenaria TaxID=6604 RepID=UPI0022E29E7D|nr:glutamate receptor U1-like [Mya arenaria]
MEALTWMLFGIIFSLVQCKELTFSTVLNEPYIYKDADGQYVGMLPELFSEMGYNVTVTEADVYGQLLPNGSWTGMMGDVINKNADFAGPLTVVGRRAEHVDFSSLFTAVGPVILMRKPPNESKPLREKLSLPFRPMELSAWLMLILALLVTGTVLYIISHFNPYEWRRMAKDREASLREQESFTCLNSFWFILSALALQGYARAPRSVGGRLVVLGWWAFLLLFLFFYIASLINVIHEPPQPFAIPGYSKIKSFEDLANNDQIGIGILRFGTTEKMFEESSDPIDKRIYEKIIKTRKEMKKQLNTTKDLVNYLRSREYSDFAAIMESDAATFVTNTLPCNLYMVTEGIVTKGTGFAFEKGSSLQREFNMNLLKAQESGLQRKLEKRWTRSKCSAAAYNPMLYDETNRVVYFVGLADLAGALLILIVAIVLGGIVTIAEICIYKCAETTVDDDDVDDHVRANQRLDASDMLLAVDSKKGGATQV